MQYQELKRTLIEGNIPDKCIVLTSLQSFNEYQRTIIIYLLDRVYRDINNELLLNTFEKNKLVGNYLLQLFQHDHCYEVYKDSSIQVSGFSVLKSIFEKKSIGEEGIKKAIDMIINNTADAVFISLFLIGIYLYGISDKDLYLLTLAMRDTGSIYDYRGRFDKKKVVRRYPTGAVSEKTALLLPSMLIIASEKYPLVSPFLVAKSLSFTGGTWDKLNSIKGFTFPLPGDETIEYLNKYGVTMTVAHSDLCPVDTILYQLRSITDTVDSIPLAVSSIASKQLACPPDFLLLDVRYGDGAFFSFKDAHILSDKLIEIMSRDNIDVLPVFTSATQPNGSSIGNAVEVCEAVSIMKCDFNNCLFVNQGMEEQKRIIANFYAMIINRIVPTINRFDLYEEAIEIIESGKLLKSFAELLIEHHVCKDTVMELINDPVCFFGLNNGFEVHSNKSGVIQHIDQIKLGDLVNFGINNLINVKSNNMVEEILESSINYYGQAINIILHKRLGDYVDEGGVLATIYGMQKNADSDLRKLYESQVLDSFVVAE